MKFENLAYKEEGFEYLETFTDSELEELSVIVQNGYNPEDLKDEVKRKEIIANLKKNHDERHDKHKKKCLELGIPEGSTDAEIENASTAKEREKLNVFKKEHREMMLKSLGLNGTESEDMIINAIEKRLKK